MSSYVRRPLAAITVLAAASYAALAGAPAQAAAAPQDIRVSRTPSGAQPDSDARTPSTSGTGRYVAYTSAASDILGPVVYDQVFLYDRQTGRTTLVSSAADGSPANATARNPVVSRDGHYVIFTSEATNLADLSIPDHQNDGEIYRYDVRTGRLAVISTQDGAALPHLTNILGLAASATGRYAVFTTNHRVLPEDTNSFQDVYRLDAVTGQVSLVTRAHDGGPTDQHSFSYAVGATGDRVVFSSQAGNLVDGATNPRKRSEIYATSLSTGRTRLVTASVDGGIADDDSSSASLTADGRRLVFLSRADDLVPGQVASDLDSIFVVDLRTGALSQVDTDAGDLGVAWPTLSDDGRRLAYATNDSTTGATQVLRLDLTTGGQEVLATNGDADHDVREPQISGDGTAVTYIRITAQLSGPNSLPTEEVRQWRQG